MSDPKAARDVGEEARGGGEEAGGGGEVAVAARAKTNI